MDLPRLKVVEGVCGSHGRVMEVLNTEQFG